MATQGFATLGTPPELSRAALGADLPVIGPAELIFAELLADPAGSAQSAIWNQ